MNWFESNTKVFYCATCGKRLALGQGNRKTCSNKCYKERLRLHRLDKYQQAVVR